MEEEKTTPKRFKFKGRLTTTLMWTQVFFLFGLIIYAFIKSLSLFATGMVAAVALPIIITILWLPRHSYLEISTQGLIYQPILDNKRLVTWQNIDAITKPRYGWAYIQYNDSEILPSNPLFSELVPDASLSHTKANVIPLGKYIPEWRDELADYIERYNIPINLS